jgi:peptidyl-prolyl cis-trans isomerase C
MKHTLIRTVQERAEPETFSGCGHGPAPAARRGAKAPPIFINGVEIAETAIALEAQNHSAVSGPEARAAAARALAIRELLLQRARDLALSPAPIRDDRGREETPEEALVRQVLELEAAAPEPTEAECRRIYEATPEKFLSPELYEASHILFRFDGEGAAAWTAAHRQAVEAIEALKQGADFAALARAHSACPTAQEGGRLGQLRPGDLSQQMERALLALRAGQFGPSPVRTRFGWHVIRLDRHAPSRLLSFETVAPRIRDSLRARAWPTAAARYVEELARRGDIEGITLGFGPGAGA